MLAACFAAAPDGVARVGHDAVDELVPARARVERPPVAPGAKVVRAAVPVARRERRQGALPLHARHHGCAAGLGQPARAGGPLQREL